jgi:hypothetical protein
VGYICYINGYHQRGGERVGLEKKACLIDLRRAVAIFAPGSGSSNLLWDVNNDRRRTGLFARGSADTLCSGVDAVETGREGTSRDDAPEEGAVWVSSACWTLSPGGSGALRTMRRSEPRAHHFGRVTAAVGVGVERAPAPPPSELELEPGMNEDAGVRDDAGVREAGVGGKYRSAGRSVKKSFTLSTIDRLRENRWRSLSGGVSSGGDGGEPRTGSTIIRIGGGPSVTTADGTTS